MSLQRQLFYEFKNFRLDPAERVLLRDGKPLSLTPKVFHLLKILVERHGHIVDKEKLITEIWANSFVEEGNLAVSAMMLRKVLADNASDPIFIETVPRRGYRFIAEVRCVEADDRQVATSDERPVLQLNAKQAASEESSHAYNRSEPQRLHAVVALADWRKEANENKEAETENVSGLESAISEPNSENKALPRFRLPQIAFALALVLIGAVALGYYFYGGKSVTSGAGDRNRIAVLPLKPINAESRDPIVEFAIAESLILKLSSARYLAVRPLGSVRRYVELDRDPTDAGRELDVDFVLSSNYQIVDGKIRVTSQLWNVRTGQTEGTFKSETDTAHAFTMQDAVANEIGDAVASRFGGDYSTFTAKRGTTNEEAYRLYLQGMYLTEKYNRSDAGKAIEIFAEAVRLDPSFAAAWAGKAHAHCNFAHRGGNAPVVEFANAEPALEKALAIDSKNADAYAVRGIINRDYRWNFAEAYTNLDRALELDPNHIFAHRVRSGLLTLDGRHDEAIVEIKKVIDLNPSWIREHWLYANALIQARRYDEAIRQSNRVREMDPSFAAAYSSLWKAYHFKGDHLMAYENFLQSKRLGGSSDADIEKFETAFRNSGWLGVLRADRDAMIENLTNDYSPTKYQIAGVSALLGDDELALKYLNECLANRLIGLSLIKVDPFLDALRGDPQFSEIVRKTGL